MATFVAQGADVVMGWGRPGAMKGGGGAVDLVKRWLATVTDALTGLGLAKRWLVAVTVALTAFGGCWLGLAAVRWKDTGTQATVAAVPLAIFLAVLAGWAEQARKPKKAGRGDQQQGDELPAGATLPSGHSLYSADRTYRLDMQEDGNLVVRKVGNRLASWASKTARKGKNSYLKMQEDGNLVVYTGENRPVWESNTAGRGGNLVTMQNDGNLVMYAPGGQIVWASRTEGITSILYKLIQREKAIPENFTEEEPKLE